MKILAIETSCDETAISVVEFPKSGQPRVLSHIVSSQTKIHEPFGGVVPNLAARAHQRNLVPVLKKSLDDARLLNSKFKNQNAKLQLKIQNEIEEILRREPELLKHFEEFVPTIETPEVDTIAVTVGPGLEPALWVGINFAKALALAWQKPLIPVNHMMGHIFSVLPKKYDKLQIPSTKLQTNFEFPAIALLVSGGHTELILMKDKHIYELLGQTRDDAVGEAFDKVARLLGLKYPGGPEISRLAEQFETLKIKDQGLGISLPRPMLDSKDYDFSFSGLKTAVRYLIEKTPNLTDEIKAEIAYEFQEAVIEVLVKKTMRAVKEYGAKTLIIGGGVIANKKLRSVFEKTLKDRNVTLLIPEMRLTTDNATMIALAAYEQLKNKNVLSPFPETLASVRAEGNLKVC